MKTEYYCLFVNKLIRIGTISTDMYILNQEIAEQYHMTIKDLQYHGIYPYVGSDYKVHKINIEKLEEVKP